MNYLPDLRRRHQLFYQHCSLTNITLKLDIVQFLVYQEKSLVGIFVKPIKYVVLLQIILLEFIYHNSSIIISKFYNNYQDQFSHHIFYLKDTL